MRRTTAMRYRLRRDIGHGLRIGNSTLGVLEADQRHCDHAIVEQVIAELKGPGYPRRPRDERPVDRRVRQVG